MGNIILLAAVAVAFVYSVIQCIPIFFPPSPRRGPPPPGLWDWIVHVASRVFHTVPYVVGGIVAIWVALFVVDWVTDYFEKKKTAEEGYLKETQARLRELEIKTTELLSKQGQFSEALRSYTEQISNLHRRLEELEARLPQRGSPDPAPKPPTPPSDSVVKGRAAVARVLSQMERGY